DLSDQMINYGIFGGIKTKMTFPLKGGRSLFVRFFLFLEPETPGEHFGFIRALGTKKAPDGADWYYELQAWSLTGGTTADQGYWEWWSHQMGYPDMQKGDYGETVPVGKWACWKWELRGDTNELAVYVNERKIPGLDIPFSKGWLAPDEVNLY